MNVVMRRGGLVLMALVLVFVTGVGAAGAQTALDQAAQTLRGDPVYVDPAAEKAGDIDAGRLRELIRSGDTPVYVAVVPAAALQEADGDPGRLAVLLGEQVRQPGTYAVLAGDVLGAASTVLPARSGRAAGLGVVPGRRPGRAPGRARNLRRAGAGCRSGGRVVVRIGLGLG